MSSEEVRLAKMWYDQDGMAPSTIAALLHRDKSTLTRLLVMERERKQDGRPRKFTEKQIDRIVAKLEEMIIEANQQYRVTVDSLKREMRIKACNRIILEALGIRGEGKNYIASVVEIGPWLCDSDKVVNAGAVV